MAVLLSGLFLSLVAAPDIAKNAIDGDLNHVARVKSATRLYNRLERVDAQMSNLANYVEHEIDALLKTFRGLKAELERHNLEASAVGDIIDYLNKRKLSGNLAALVHNFEGFGAALIMSKIKGPRNWGVKKPEELDRLLTLLKESVEKTIDAAPRSAQKIREQLLRPTKVITDLKEEFRAELDRLPPFSDEAEQMKRLLENLTMIESRAHRAFEIAERSNQAAIIAAVRDGKDEDLERLVRGTHLNLAEIRVMEADGCFKSLLEIAKGTKVRKILQDRIQ